MTSDSERAVIARWARTWETAGLALTQIERRELREMTEAEWRQAVHAVLSAVPPCDDAPPTSGLIEQQKWFKRICPTHRC